MHSNLAEHSERATPITPRGLTPSTHHEPPTTRDLHAKRPGASPITIALDNRTLSARVAKRTDPQALVDRAKHLPLDERAVVEAVLGAGQSAAAVARLMRVPARSVRRLLQGAVRRMNSAEFLFVLSRRDAWTGVRRHVATCCFIEGRSMREAAQRTGTSLHAVRRHCEAVRGQAEEATLAARIAARASA